MNKVNLNEDGVAVDGKGKIDYDGTDFDKLISHAYKKQ